jgi:hypothetical protein
MHDDVASIIRQALPYAAARPAPRAIPAPRTAGTASCPCLRQYTMSKQSGRRMRRVCAGTPVHYEQTLREEDAASVCGRGGCDREHVNTQ